MDDTGFVCGLKRLGDLLGYRESFIERDRPLSNAVCQGWAFDQFEDQRLLPLGFLQPVDVPDVGMVQRGQDFGFALEPGESIRIFREGLAQNLQRHIPVELGVPGSIELR